MQTLFPSKQFVRSNPNRHLTSTVWLPHHDHHGFISYTTIPPPLQSARRVSYNGLFKPKVSCKFVADHGEFRSTRVEFRRRNFLFNQRINHQRTWPLHTTRRSAHAAGAVKGLIFTNVVVYLLWKIADENFMMENFTKQLDNFNNGRYHTMITPAFSHHDLSHILANMISLYVYGKRIEQRFGPEFLLLLYLVGAFGSSVSFLVHRAALVPSSKENRLTKPDPSKAVGLGASGAVRAIWMLDTLISQGVTSFMVFTILEDIYRVKVDSHISGSGHLGGAGVGVIAWAWLRKRRL